PPATARGPALAGDRRTGPAEHGPRHRAGRRTDLPPRQGRHHGSVSFRPRRRTRGPLPPRGGHGIPLGRERQDRRPRNPPPVGRDRILLHRVPGNPVGTPPRHSRPEFYREAEEASTGGAFRPRRAVLLEQRNVLLEGGGLPPGARDAPPGDRRGPG